MSGRNISLFGTDPKSTFTLFTLLQLLNYFDLKCKLKSYKVVNMCYCLHGFDMNIIKIFAVSKFKWLFIASPKDNNAQFKT